MLEAEEARKKHLAKLNETVIYKNGDAFAFGYSAFYTGSLDNLIPFDKDFFKWNIDEDARIFECETVYSLTLGELVEQLKQAKFNGLVTLIVQRPMSGKIYQMGNYSPYEWYALGELRGFC